MRIGNVCTETCCYALHNNFQALVLPCHKDCVGCACCAADQPTHRFVVIQRQDPNRGKSGLALTPISQWGKIVLFMAFASAGKEGVTSDVTPHTIFPPPQLSPRMEKWLQRPVWSPDKLSGLHSCAMWQGLVFQSRSIAFPVPPMRIWCLASLRKRVTSCKAWPALSPLLFDLEDFLAYLFEL